jgi:single-strand DNA-binding protein
MKFASNERALTSETQANPARAAPPAALAGEAAMFYLRSMTHALPRWPRPPRCLVAADLAIPPNGARVAVAGHVVSRQRPGTAKGVIFVTLEDETGTANVVVWARTFERFRRAVIAGRCLKVTGRVQRDGEVIHVVAEAIEDISPLLDEIVGIAALPAPVEWPRGAAEPPLRAPRAALSSRG